MKESTKILKKIRELKVAFLNIQNFELAAMARDMEKKYEKIIEKK